MNASLAVDTLPRLDFDAEAHTYTLHTPGGGVQPLPSVTTVLRSVGLINFDGVPSGILSNAQARGTRVHKAAQFLTEGTLDWSTVDEAEKGYVEAYAAFLATSKFQVLAQEVRLWNAVWRYAGTCDDIGWWDGYPAVGDIKTGSATAVAARYQLAAYEDCLRRMPPLEWIDVSETAPIHRVSIEVKKDGTYRAEVYDDPNDFNVWLAALTVFSAIQQKTGGRA